MAEFYLKGEKLNSLVSKEKKNVKTMENKKKTSKESTFLEGVLKEKNTARMEEKDQDSMVTELNQNFHSLQEFSL